jgi:hypothetical protein
MTRTMFGVETEYAIAGVSSNDAMIKERIVQRLMDSARRALVHLPDLHSPNGLFLSNGSRFYLDCGVHPEICTPECTNPWDVVRYIEAGHRILGSLISSLHSTFEPGAEIIAYRCNVDYSGSQSTWGCHESYLHSVSQHALRPQLVPHLVTRLLYTGAGGFDPTSPGLSFMLSPRMALFRRVESENSTSDRGIWHSKSESLCSGYNRLHVICGESLCSGVANFLKVGTTALIVAMTDAGLTPGSRVALANPLAALQQVAKDPTCSRPIKMADGGHMTAVAIQRHYLEQAESNRGADFMPEWTPEICREWRAILDRLERSPESTADTLDWTIKQALYSHEVGNFGIRWEDLPLVTRALRSTVERAGDETSDASQSLRTRLRRSKGAIGKKSPAEEPLLRFHGLGLEDLRAFEAGRQKLFEIDTRFGQLGPKGVFHSLEAAGVLNHRVSGVENIERALTEPPPHGRAALRGRVVQRLAGSTRSHCYWERIINQTDSTELDLADPFGTEERWDRLSRSGLRDARMPPGFWMAIEPDDDPEAAGQTGPVARRQAALSCYLNGNYVEAEDLIRGLLAERFEVASNHCHLARIMILVDRFEEARQQIAYARSEVNDSPTYVLPRILFLELIFAMLDGGDCCDISARIGATLSTSGAQLEWIVQPVLDHLRSDLGERRYEFLRAIAAALSGEIAIPESEDASLWSVPADPHIAHGRNARRTSPEGQVPF